MANKVIKGLTVEIGGDTTKLGKALDAADKQSRSLSDELRSIDKLLQFDDVNPELLAQKQKVLADQISGTEEKLQMLKAAQEQAAAAFERGEVSAEQMRALEREVISAESALKRYGASADDTARKLESIGKNPLTETIKDQESALAKLKTEYVNTAAAEGKNSDAAKALAQEIEALSGDLKQNRQSLSDAEREADSFDKTVDDLGDSAEDTGRDLSGLTDALGACLKVAASAAAAVGAAAVKMTVDAVNAFGELEQNLGGAEAVFNELGESIADMNVAVQSTSNEFGEVRTEIKSLAEVSEDAYRTMGISQSEYLASINKMGALFQGSGLEQQEALDLSANAMQRAADVASVMGIDVSAAMESITGAAKGNFTMMDNLGVAMNATTIQAYALKNGLVSEGEATVDIKKVADAQDKAAKATLNAEKAQITYNDAVRKYGEDSANAQKALIELQKAQVDEEAAARKVEEAMAGAEESEGSWWKNASNADKARVAMQMFLETTEQYDGNFAREANETISGSFGLLKSSLESLTAGLGNSEADITNLTSNVVDAFLSVTKNVIPVVESIGAALPEAIGVLAEGAAEQLPELLPILTDTLTNIIGALVDAFPDIADQILTLVLNLAPALISAATELLTSLTMTLLNMAPDILRTLMQVASSVISELGTVLPELLDTLFTDVLPALITNYFAYLPDMTEALSNAIGAVAERLPDMIAGLVDYLPEIIDTVIYGITQSLPSIIKALVSVFKGVAAAIPPLIKSLPDVVGTLVSGIAEMLPQILDGITELVEAIVDALPDIVNTIVEALPALALGIVNALTAMLPQIIECGITLLTALISALPQIIRTICAALPALVKGIVDGILSAVPQIIQCGITLLMALIQALPTIITEIVKAIPQITTSIIKAILDALPLLIDCGIQLFVALVQNLPAIITGIVNALPDLISGIIDGLLDALPQLIECGITLFVALIENIPAIIAGIVKAIPQIISAIVSAIEERISAIADVGARLIEGLWQGISDMGAWIKSKISGFFDGIVDGIKDFFGIASPSKLMRDQIGKNIALGVAEGIEDNGDTVSDAMQDMAADVADTDFTPPDIPEMELPDVPEIPPQEIRYESEVDAPEIPEIPVQHIEFDSNLDNLDTLLQSFPWFTPDTKMQQVPLRIEPEISLDSISSSMKLSGQTTQIVMFDSNVMEKLDAILSAVEQGQVIELDSDRLVGGTADKYNAAFVEMQTLSERGVK